MNWQMIRHLVRKDWHFNRFIMLFYLLSGVLCLAAMPLPLENAFSIAAILLIVVLFSLGVHVVIDSILYERQQMTLPFVMSLPVTSIDYTAAKLLSILAVFVVPWLAIVAGAVVTTFVSSSIPNGAVTYFLVILIQFVVIFSLMLGTALVTESTGGTVVMIVAANLLLQFTLHYVPKLPDFQASLNSETVSWSPAFFAIVGLQVTAVLAVLGATFYLQSRKTDFI